MEWTSIISSVVGVGTAAAGGGIFGLISAGLGAWAKHKQLQAERLYQEKKWDYELRLIDAQSERDRQRAEDDLKLASSEGAWRGLGSSIAHDRATAVSRYHWPWLGDAVNAVRSLFRPVLTTGLFVLVYLIFRDLRGAIMSGDPDADNWLAVMTETEVRDLIKYIVYSVVFTAMTAGTWWFGDRAFTPPGMKHR